MVAKTIKKQILIKLIKPIFEDIGAGFSSRRPKGVQHIKGKEDRDNFKKEYIEQNDEALEDYINVRGKQNIDKSSSKKSDDSKKELKVNLDVPEMSEQDSNDKVLAEMKEVLEVIKDNTKPMSFKEKVLAKKEDDSDDKALQELIKTLKDKEDTSVSVSEGDSGSLLGDLIGGSLGGDSGIDIGLDTDLDLDRDRGSKKGKKGLFKRAKDFVGSKKTGMMSKIGNVASKGGGMLATGARALGGLAMANPVTFITRTWIKQ